jgi:hypothetical protein
MLSSAENRPILSPELTKIDYILEAAAIFALLAMWILAIIAFRSLPEIIPTHFNLNGRPDGRGSKYNLFILPFLCMVLAIGLSILNKYPHKFNYIIKVTEENALRLYSKGTRMLRIIKVIAVFSFLAIEWQMSNSAESSLQSGWILTVVLIFPVVLPIMLAFMFTKKSHSR